MNKKYCSRATAVNEPVFYPGNCDAWRRRVNKWCKRNFSSEKQVLRKKNPHFIRQVNAINIADEITQYQIKMPCTGSGARHFYIKHSTVLSGRRRQTQE
jgi:hypothetical protein